MCLSIIVDLVVIYVFMCFLSVNVNQVSAVSETYDGTSDFG